eukprot:gene10210-21281_t
MLYENQLSQNPIKTIRGSDDTMDPVFLQIPYPPYKKHMAMKYRQKSSSTPPTLEQLLQSIHSNTSSDIKSNPSIHQLQLQLPTDNSPEALDFIDLSSTSTSTSIRFKETPKTKISDTPFELPFLTSSISSISSANTLLSRLYNHTMAYTSSSSLPVSSSSSDTIPPLPLSSQVSSIGIESTFPVQVSIPWIEFLKLPSKPIVEAGVVEEDKSTRKISFPGSLRQHQCPARIVKALGEKLSEKDVQWCQWALKEGGVRVGKSWGKLNSAEQRRYSTLSCNAVCGGKNPSCDDVRVSVRVSTWGDVAIKNWLLNEIDATGTRINHNAGVTSKSKPFCPKNANSKVRCFNSDATNRICMYQNVMIDFNKMHKVERPNKTPSRKWDRGFLSGDCGSQGREIPDYWPVGYSPMLDTSTSTCDYVFPETVIIYSHDELRNIGHTMQDLMNVWLMTVLAGQSETAKDISFINLDALRLYNNHNDETNEFF